jgi:CelD/BcsL family acetyltransferase involved in cellulose biosynthesis
MDVFVNLFRSNTPGKARFMNAARESFFRSLTNALAEAGLVKLSLLEINDTPAAATLCFDYRSTVYIYNNGYDGKYGSLSVGLLSKAFSIRHSIEQGKRKYDFLKGDETYKGRLGGAPVQLHRCWVKLKSN